VSTAQPLPRPEYPRPQFVRPDWLNLNGPWQFEADQGDSGLERGLVNRALAAEITVPFAPEAELSGIGETDFFQAVWYRREVTLPAGWAGRRILLHFGACDFDTTVWADGREVGRHRGGFASFTVDLTGAATPGQTVTLVVRARDAAKGPQARGKQSTWYHNSECFYTRTTGIWQTVWLEPVDPAHIVALDIVPQRADGTFWVTATLSPACAGGTLEVTLSDDAGPVAQAVVAADDLAPRVVLPIPESRRRLWSPADPFLYGLKARLVRDGRELDAVTSYAGLRSIALDGRRLLLNGEPVFQRLVLDQGYWPESIMTAPSDEALIRDIKLAQAAGFNGARLHQRAVEERYLYHADRLGFLVWGEYGDWGVGGFGPRGDNQRPPAAFVGEWVDLVVRDRSHPALVGWCPLNETHQVLHDRITQLDDVTYGLYVATKAADPTRPVIDASGYSHRVRGADVYDSHSYEQDPAAFAAQQAGLAEGAPFVNLLDGEAMSLPYAGQPYFVSEFGGIWWNPALAESADADPGRRQSWGYGERVRSLDEWYDRFAGLVGVLLGNPDMFGYCFTQLTDVFQEENGILDFRRRPKFDLARLHSIQTRPAAYERPAP
jgi:beta-glucuronidase